MSCRRITKKAYNFTDPVNDPVNYTDSMTSSNEIHKAIQQLANFSTKKQEIQHKIGHQINSVIFSEKKISKKIPKI